jgi:hypothetical protein
VVRGYLHPTEIGNKEDLTVDSIQQSSLAFKITKLVKKLTPDEQILVLVNSNLFNNENGLADKISRLKGDLHIKVKSVPLS